MKTAISVPDPVFEAAEALARRLGMSRSQLYTQAIEKYLSTFDDEAVTQALNEVYADAAEPVDPVLAHMQYLSLPVEKW
ncbi:MAG: CopG family transcriptional regulator [Anaerolineales bacterium]|nr:CopG family transcriptional regulator [Anaerolineales bacterium]